MMTARQALESGTQQLIAYLSSEPSARQEARWLLCHALQTTLPSLLTNLEQIVSKEDSRAYFSFISDRIQKHKPLAYILGSAPFCGLEIKVKAPFLIPRHETEELVWSLITKMKGQENLHILDLCTGTGAIALAFAANFPSAQITASDINEEVLELARSNQKALNISNVNFMHADLFKGLENQLFDMIISNPPYLTEKEWAQLTPDVKEWESRQALIGGEDGLEVYAHIIKQARAHLTSKFTAAPLPQLVLEHGSTQAASIGTMLDAEGFGKHTVWVDSFKNNRAVLANIQAVAHTKTL